VAWFLPLEQIFTFLFSRDPLADLHGLLCGLRKCQFDGRERRSRYCSGGNEASL
jgi:hypothetical protein